MAEGFPMILIDLIALVAVGVFSAFYLTISMLVKLAITSIQSVILNALHHCGNLFQQLKSDFLNNIQTNRKQYPNNRAVKWIHQNNQQALKKKWRSLK